MTRHVYSSRTRTTRTPECRGWGRCRNTGRCCRTVHSFAEVKERDHPEEQMLSVTITKGVIRQQALLVDSSKKDSSNQDKSAYKLVRPGDIAYNKMRAWQGAVGVSDYQGIVSPAYVVERPRDGTDSRYLHYLLRTPAFSKEAERWSYGITSDMWSLRPEHFKMIYGCLPPLPEQATIVRFLDHADRRIRALHPRPAAAGYAAGGAEAGHHPPGRYGPDRRSHREAVPGLQALPAWSGLGTCRRIGK